MKIPFFIICLFVVLVSCNNDVTETIYVSGKTAKCTGVAEQECLQIKFNPDEDYTLYYDAIEGFQHEQGTDYTLKIKRTTVKNPPADGSSFKFSLIEILDKQPTPLTLEDGSWLVVGILEFNGNFNRDPLLTFSPTLNEINGSTGCNRLFGKIITNQNNLTFQNIGSTRMACDDDGLEAKFLNTLEKTHSYKIVENILMLLNADDTVMLKAQNIERKE